jgi:hypothetical protein
MTSTAATYEVDRKVIITGRLDCELHQMLTGHLWVMRVQASLALARSVEPGT